jgi:hypothetical protein
MDFPPIFSEEHYTPPVKWGIFYSLLHTYIYLFISFAPPKEMNQRKRGRNRAVGELGAAK